jgi:HEXXH motif-containing protein
MEVPASIYQFMQYPLPTWETEGTTELVKAFSASASVEPPNSSLGELVYSGSGGATYLRIAMQDSRDFYDENGLLALSGAEVQDIKAASKIGGALEFLEMVDPVAPCISHLVRTMEVVGSEDPDTDVSYSHPDLPATIFFSVCKDNGTASRLRVAESILHETMHLKLSLIERMIPVVIPGASGRFFSPWRDELRPAQGVVHGIFVFRTLLEFFKEAEGWAKDREAVDHVRERRFQIAEELASLSGFGRCPDLTPAGASLIACLLPSS